ncbi:MAG: YceI family protein [Bacteroidales bacterium]|jgi:polyisoprenoid-binding protein YceI
MKTSKWIFIGVLLILAFITPVSKTLKFDKQKSRIVIAGTSNLHDWEETITKFDGELVLNTDEKVVKSYNSVNLNFYSVSISSGKSIMDNKTKEALKAEKFPVINFRSQQIKEVRDMNNKKQVVVFGNLTIAGVTKYIDVGGFNTVTTDGGILFEGKKNINMSDFGIKPPTALMGTLVVGNKVSVIFNIYFN